MTPTAGREGRIATGRGDARRTAILAAATRLLEERGFAATSHRTVARAAGVPLASTTYYFASRQDLVAEALGAIGERYLTQARRIASKPGSGPLARQLIEMVAGRGPSAEHASLLTFYECYIQAGRTPAYAKVVRGWTRELTDLVATVLVRAGHSNPTTTARYLVAAIDGLLLVALADGRTRPALALEKDVAGLLDQLCDRSRPG